VTDKPKKGKKGKKEREEVPDLSGLTDPEDVERAVRGLKARGTGQPEGETFADEYERTMLSIDAHPQRTLLDVYCKVRGCGKSLGVFQFSDGVWCFLAWGHGGVELDCFTTAPTMKSPPFRLPTRDDRSPAKLRLLVTCPKGHEREIENWQAMRAIEAGERSIRV
jgi:hypothetical protein